MMQEVIDKLNEAFLPKNLECDGGCCTGCWKDVVRDAIKMLEQSRQAAVTPALGGWISVEERRRLPKPNEWVLIHHKENGIYVGYSTDSAARSWVIVGDSHQFCDLGQTDFWAPIPKLPPNSG